MQLLLNIGLAREGDTPLDPLFVVDKVDAVFRGRVDSFKFYEHGTEPTLVIRLDDCGLDANQVSLRVDHLARLFDQDCIAVYYPEADHGALVGPNAANWGEFNPAFFLLPDGRRLSETFTPIAA